MEDWAAVFVDCWRLQSVRSSSSNVIIMPATSFARSWLPDGPDRLLFFCASHYPTIIRRSPDVPSIQYSPSHAIARHYSSSYIITIPGASLIRTRTGRREIHGRQSLNDIIKYVYSALNRLPLMSRWLHGLLVNRNTNGGLLSFERCWSHQQRPTVAHGVGAARIASGGAREGSKLPRIRRLIWQKPLYQMTPGQNARVLIVCAIKTKFVGWQKKKINATKPGGDSKRGVALNSRGLSLTKRLLLFHSFYERNSKSLPNYAKHSDGNPLSWHKQYSVRQRDNYRDINIAT